MSRSALDISRDVVRETDSRIVLLVIDGLGGLPHPETGKTELETASTPNLDRLLEKGECGLIVPVGPGITPGSAPGHLALFGYEPTEYEIGRGVLEALGIDFELRPGDVAIRGNFCTVDRQGLIVDRRAGRISTEECRRLCLVLSRIAFDGVETFILPVREHRFAIVLRGEGLGDKVSDTDPQKEGLPPLPARALSPDSERTARLANEFVSRARELLREDHTANMVLLRGFSRLPSLPSLGQKFKLRPAAIAAYPMYRGLSRVVGMEVLPTGPSPREEIETLKEHFERFNFFFVHIKGADLAGEDGDFERKVKVIEEVDGLLPQVLGLGPEVLVVTGDHSTPALFKGHSWHPVPCLLYSRWCRPHGEGKFGERTCARGTLGVFPAVGIMPLALAHAGKLTKYGA